MKRIPWQSAFKYILCCILAIYVDLAFDFGKGKQAILFVFLALSIIMELYRLKSVPVEFSSDKKRRPELDILRVLAAVLVIALHAFHIIQNENGIVSEKTCNVLSSVLLSCNFLFIMLSGALAFRPKNQNPLLYYADRAIRIAVPMFVYYLWNYFWYAPLSEIMNKDFFRQFLLDLLKGNVELSPQFWLLYPILAIYIAAPFIRYMTERMPHSMLSFLAIVGVICLAVSSRFDYAMTSYLPYWIIVGIIGYWIVQPETRRYDRVILLTGLLSFIALCLIQFNTIEQGYGLVCIIACSLCSLVFCLCKRKAPGKSFCAVLSLLGKYSFGIMLIHWWVLYNIVKEILAGKTVFMGGTCVIPAILLTFAVSLLYACLFDNTFIFVIATALKKLVLCISGLLNRLFRGKS